MSSSLERAIVMDCHHVVSKIFWLGLMEWVTNKKFCTYIPPQLTTHKKHANTNDHGRRRPIADTPYEMVVLTTAGSPTVAHLRF